MSDNDAGAAATPNGQAEVGVGPHPTPWPEDDRLDPQLLAEGDRRNVADRFRYWSLDAIVAELDRDPVPIEVAIENWEHDFNIGTVVRNANAFGVRHVHVVGRRRWNRRGAMVTDRYLHVQHHSEVDSLVEHARRERLAVVGIDNVAGSQRIETSPLPERCLLVFGAEGPGLSAQMLDAVDQLRGITMHGSTRSLNAGVASGIALYAWSTAHRTGETHV